MPGRIVTETCPAPECTLTVAEIEQFLPELTSYLGLLAGSFVHQSQWAWCGVYLQGVLGEADGVVLIDEMLCCSITTD